MTAGAPPSAPLVRWIAKSGRDCRSGNCVAGARSHERAADHSDPAPADAEEPRHDVSQQRSDCRRHAATSVRRRDRRTEISTRCRTLPRARSRKSSARPPASSRTCGCAPTTAPAGPAATTCARPSKTRPAGHHVRDRRTRRRRPRRGRLAPARARRGPGGEERPLAAGPRRPPVPGPAPRRAHRHPGGEPPRRALGDHGRAQPGHPRHRRAVPDALRHPRRAARERRRRGAAAPHHAPLPAAPGQDRSDDRGRPPRQDRDHPALPADPRAGLALPHDRRRHAGEDRRLHRHRPARQRAGGDDQAQAGLQPPGVAAARRLADRPPLRQGRAAGGDPRRGPRGGRPRPVLHPVRRVRAPARPHLSARLDTEIAFLHGGVPRRRREEIVAALPGGPGRDGARRSCCLAEGGRHRADADGRDARRAPRPLVEPGRRAAGHGPRLPDRAAPDRAGPHVLLPRHRRGADRRAGAFEARALRTGGRRRRGLAHRAVHGHAARAVRPRRRRGAGRRGGSGRRSAEPVRVAG